MAISKKAGFFLGTAVCLDAFATGGSASLAGLGISNILKSLSETGINIFAGLSAHHFSKDDDSELNHQLEDAFQKAVETTIFSVKKDFIKENVLDVPWWRKQSIKYGFDIPSFDENYTLRNSLERNFFQPILSALNDENVIKEILFQNHELNTTEFIKKLVKNNNIQLPEFRKEHQAGLTKALLDGFQDRFIYHFIHNLIKSEPARKYYQIQLLQTSVSSLTKIDHNVDELLDFAEFYKVSLSGINKSISENRKELIDEFQKLQNEFLNQFSLKLITYRNKKIDIRDQFRFESLFTTFQGRVRELDKLSDFLFSKSKFSFYAVSGPGGAGKSRLANECCLRAESARWIAGFSDEDKNKQFNWDSFQPNAPTLIVFDYIKGRKEEISKILETLSYLAEQGNLEQKVRVLLLERDFDEGLRQKVFNLKTRTHYFTYSLNEKETTLQLAKMEEDSRWKIIEQVISELDDPDMLSDVLSRKDSILLGLDKQDPEKRPLFAFFSAVALSEGVSISGWNTNDNLKYHLHRLENKVWSQLDIWKNKNLRTTLGNLIWLAAICEDLTFEDIEKIKNLSPFKRLNDYWEEDSFWEQLESLFKMENSEESKTNFPGLKPDLLAEYYITNHISKTLKNPRLLKSLPILYNAAWNIRPDRVWLMSYLSISNFYNEASSGLNHYLKWVSIAKDLKNEYVGLFFYNLAHLNQRLSRMEEAEKFFLLAIKNNHFGAPNNLGVFYQNLDRLDEAIKYFLIAIENGDEGTLNNLAILYQKMNLKEKAEDLYLKAIEKGCVEPISNLAILYQEMGKLDEAEKYCLLAIKNGIVPAFNNLAIIYQKKDRVKEAENNFLLAIEKGYYYSYRNLAILYQKLDRFKEAEKFYLKAIKVGDLDALNNIGELYLKQGRFYEAEKYFLMAIKNGHLFVFNNLAIVNQNLNRLDKAEKYFLKAIELGLARPLLGLAILYANSGRIKEAEKYFLKAIDKKIEDALFNLALLYDNDDQLQKAEKYYLKSIEKGNIDSLNNLAVIYENNNRLKEAEQFYQKAKKKGFIGAFNNLAVFYWKINKNKDSSWELVNLYIEKNMVKTLKDHVIRLIISAWVQNPFYQQYRSIIFEKVLMEQPNLIRIYILILYHDHSNFLLNAFEERNRVIQSKTIHELEYLVTLYFNKPDDSRLKSIPPKLKNKYDELVTDILGKREFYKKKE